MADKFWLGGYFIDVSRNQITHHSTTQTLPPKALAVLTFLARHQGQVVSQDTLLAEVWRDTIVSPNTLQRCIAQLRKALGDDGKEQSLIKTHAKKGYSLECSIRWGEDNSERSPIAEVKAGTQSSSAATTPPANTSSATQAKKRYIAGALTACFIVIGLAAVIAGFWSQQSHGISVKHIRPLTSTDNRELASQYSPDGQYVLFKRFPDVMCVNNLWAKKLATQEEFQLTEMPGNYDSATLSADGKTLAFVQQENCTEPVTQKHCYKLQHIDFQKALVAPQSPTTLLQCEHSEIRNAIWISGDNIAMLQKNAGRWQLISYSVSHNTTALIYAVDDGNILDFDYSPALNKIALTTIRSNGLFYIDVLTAAGEILTSNKIAFPDTIPAFRHIYPNFSPRDNQLVFSTGSQLFTLSFDGSVSQISTPFDEAIGTPVFHPDGTRMLAIKGHYDSDIVSVPLSQFQKGQTIQAIHSEQAERSTQGEDYAKFQPNGDMMAFWSDRSGTTQIWLKSGNTTRQLSHFPANTYIYEFVWSTDGTGILVSASSELVRFDLAGHITVLDIPNPVYNLYHWDTDSQRALATARIEGILTFVDIDLASSTVRAITDRPVAWAQKTRQGELIYMDEMGRFWRPAAAEDQLIPALNGQGSERRFVVGDDMIYGINDDFQLWSYHLGELQFSILGNVPDTIDYITDVDQHNILMTERIAARKEVVELILD